MTLFDVKHVMGQLLILTRIFQHLTLTLNMLRTLLLDNVA